VVIEPAKEDAELGPQAADATVEPAPCLLPAQPVRDRNDQRLRHGALHYLSPVSVGDLAGRFDECGEELSSIAITGVRPR
jgi:hypothetical protein